MPGANDAARLRIQQSLGGCQKSAAVRCRCQLGFKVQLAVTDLLRCFGRCVTLCLQECGLAALPRGAEELYRDGHAFAGSRRTCQYDEQVCCERFL